MRYLRGKGNERNSSDERHYFIHRVACIAVVVHFISFSNGEEVCVSALLSLINSIEVTLDSPQPGFVALSTASDCRNDKRRGKNYWVSSGNKTTRQQQGKIYKLFPLLIEKYTKSQNKLFPKWLCMTSDDTKKQAYRKENGFLLLIYFSPYTFRERERKRRIAAKSATAAGSSHSDGIRGQKLPRLFLLPSFLPVSVGLVGGFYSVAWSLLSSPASTWNVEWIPTIIARF